MKTKKQRRGASYTGLIEHWKPDDNDEDFREFLTRTDVHSFTLTEVLPDCLGMQVGDHREFMLRRDPTVFELVNFKQALRDTWKDRPEPAAPKVTRDGMTLTVVCEAPSAADEDS